MVSQTTPWTWGMQRNVYGSCTREHPLWPAGIHGKGKEKVGERGGDDGKERRKGERGRKGERLTKLYGKSKREGRRRRES